MENKFNFEKSYSANILQSIRFDEELHNRITKVKERRKRNIASMDLWYPLVNMYWIILLKNKYFYSWRS